MRKVDKKVEERRRKNAEKRNARTKARKGIRQETLNHKVNLIEAKKKELFGRWMEMVNKTFEERKNVK